MEAPAAEQVSSMVFALICLITYELLVEIFRMPKPIFKAFAGCWNLMADSRRYVLPTLLPRPYRRCIKLFARCGSTQNIVLMTTVHKLSHINLMLRVREICHGHTLLRSLADAALRAHILARVMGEALPWGLPRARSDSELATGRPDCAK
jgi:hypothetical protein